MDSFENLIAMLLRREGYWTATCVKVDLSKAEKRQIGLPSAPRWEIDVVAYRGATNELLAVECKSFLDSPGVQFDGKHFQSTKRYKLFEDETLRRVVLGALVRQLVASGSCGKAPKIRLALAIGKIAGSTSLDALKAHFEREGWILYDPDWVYERLTHASKGAYENDIACVVSKLILRRRERV